MESQAASLRAAIAKSKQGAGRWRCPSHLRSEVVSYTRRRREAGASFKVVATELGVSENSLIRWQRETNGGRSASLLPVRVADDRDFQKSSEGVVVVTPRGYRVEGLTVASAASLLARL